MRINFVIPGGGIHGGVRAVVSIARELELRGHTVFITYEDPGFSSRLKSLIASQGLLKGLLGFYYESRSEISGERWFYCPSSILFPVKTLSPENFPPADVIIATSWPTARPVYMADSEKGRKYYFIQHYETWDGTVKEVDDTWRLPLRKIVVSSWLAKIAEKLQVEVAAVVPCGVDERLFHPSGRRVSSPLRVGMMYHVYDWKGTPDGIAAVEKARSVVPDLEFLLYGAYHPRESLPSYSRFYFKPPQKLIPKLYNSCHAWLCPSLVEGGGLPSQEAMACGCAVVSTDVGSVRDFGVPGRTVLISPPGDVEALVCNLIRVLTEDSLRERMGRLGAERMKLFTWARTAEKFLRLFERDL